MIQTATVHAADKRRLAIGLMRLVRPSNSLPASLLVLIGAYLAAGWPVARPAWQAAAAMWCVTAFGYASNDYFDIHEDSINKPDRPLPAGIVSAQGVAWLAAGLALGALLFSLPLGGLPTIVAISVMGLLTLYNIRLKATAGGGNLLIALLAGCTLLAGSVAVGGLNHSAVEAVLAPACILSTFVAAREMLKALEDVHGDRAAGKTTIATQLGARGVLRLVGCLSGVTIGLSLIPFYGQGYSSAYLLVVELGIGAPLVFATVYLWRDAHSHRVSRCLALLKGSYFAGLLALLLA